MRVFSIFIASVVAIHAMVATCIAQELVINKRFCIDVSDNAPSPTSRCPQTTPDEEAACPTGPCYGYSHEGCEYYKQPAKLSQRSFQNDGAVKTKVDIGGNVPSGKIPKDPGVDKHILCYKERFCVCVEFRPGQYRCETRDWNNMVLIPWEITTKPCFLAIP